MAAQNYNSFKGSTFFWPPQAPLCTLTHTHKISIVKRGYIWGWLGLSGGPVIEGLCPCLIVEGSTVLLVITTCPGSLHKHVGKPCDELCVCVFVFANVCAWACVERSEADVGFFSPLFSTIFFETGSLSLELFHCLDCLTFEPLGSIYSWLRPSAGVIGIHHPTWLLCGS